MNIGTMLERLGLHEMVENATEEEQKILDQDLEVHYQESYPLKASVVAAGLLHPDEDDLDEDEDAQPKLVLALGSQHYNDPYGKKEAWEV